MEEEEKKFDRRFIIPVVMFVFYLGLFIFAKIVAPGNPRKNLSGLAPAVIIPNILIPVFSVVISVVGSIGSIGLMRLKKILYSIFYSLAIVVLNALLCVSLLYVLFNIYSFAPSKEGIWYAEYFIFVIRIGIMASVPVLILALLTAFILKD